MTRVRASVGLVSAAMLVMSAAAHSLAGWPALRQQLAAAGVPADLQSGLAVGWHFGGIAMLTFGVIALVVFARRWQGEPASLAAPRAIAVAYLGFGAWALATSGFDPFFLVFLVPGALMAVAAT